MVSGFDKVVIGTGVPEDVLGVDGALLLVLGGSVTTVVL